MKKMILSILMLLTLDLWGQAALQVIHNSADLAASTVDIYVNDALYEGDFNFREATEFRDVPAGVELSIDIAPGNSSSSAESIFNAKVTLENGKKYVVIASGIVSPAGYDPATPFGLYVYDMAMDTAATGKTNVNVFHGATDAPIVDVVETAVPAGTIIDDLAYGQFSGVLELPTLDFIIDVRDQSGATTVISYAAPLQSLGLQGVGLTVVASGFLNPAANNNGPGFGLFVALPSGGELIALPLSTRTKETGYFDLRVFPNPASEYLVVQSENDMQNIRLLDLNGREIVSKNMENTKEFTLELPDLQNGYYLIEVRDNNKKIGLQKVVKI